MMPQVKKIYHIHTDLKFIHESQRYNDNKFDNHLIIIGNLKERIKIDYEKVTFFDSKNDIVQEVVDFLQDADLVIINELCEIKQEIVKKIPYSIPIGWRFFGHELYGSRRDLMLSKLTLEIVEEREKYLNDFIFKCALNLKYIKRKVSFYRKQKIISRINFILIFFDEEYEFLRKHWKLPKYQKLNINFKIPELVEIPIKKKKLIIGNSRNIYNNHLDILQIIKSVNDPEMEYNLLFNYGATGRYSDYVENYAGPIKNVKLIKDFLQKEEFENIYKDTAALAINSYRQMALGNIVAGIKYGVKIYLNERNPTKKWLLRNGIKVFSISQLEEDLRNSEIFLPEDVMKSNVENYNRIADDFNKDEFNKEIYNIIV